MRRTTILIILVTICVSILCTRIKITNLKCISYDEKLLHFRYCYLKVIRRGIVAVFGYAENYGRDFYNITYRVEFKRKENGYHPFLYNISGKLCNLYNNIRTNPVLKAVYDTADENVKMLIHKCPYNNDIFVHNFTLREDILDRLPVPSGDYLVVLSLLIKKEFLAQLLGYGTLT